LTTQLAQRRFLSIVGPGGIGKTTVAIAVAETVSASYRDGVWFVELASLTDPYLVPSALSAVLGISLSTVNPISGVTAWLRDKHALIVLDSCEHVIGAAASIAEAVLRAAPEHMHSRYQPRTVAGRRRMATPSRFLGNSPAKRISAASSNSSGQSGSSSTPATIRCSACRAS
jgi:predicted ATPase